MWDLHEMLIGTFAHVAVLLPSIIFSDAQHADALFDQQINNPLTGSEHKAKTIQVRDGGISYMATHT
ncbi:hypothetical protein KSF_061610 [Reticulibacter mediterranei]|uniref:Uncharacterized protein n=1 Tax=Reticulibacter mediterranei TaxID=2778369 RepID=A0A8J3N542_9CHLR|nr:hypothetical protein KSF_061610 [Reticulibacter mediterranei]